MQPFIVVEGNVTPTVIFGRLIRKSCPVTHITVWAKRRGRTAHVERWNNTLRQRLGRFVRKTLSFSKSDTFHELALKLFIHDYNLQCIS